VVGFQSNFTAVSGQGGLGVLTRIHGNLNSDKYCEVLQEIFPVIIDEFLDNDFIFMHDRHPAHTSARTREFLQEEYPGIAERMLDWPPKGADLNPIENIWSLLVYGVSQLSRLFGIPTNADQLFEYTEIIWSAIRDQNLHINYIQSMPTRMNGCFENIGDGLTIYLMYK
jgi:hypothetical protein